MYGTCEVTGIVLRTWVILENKLNPSFILPYSDIERFEIFLMAKGNFFIHVCISSCWVSPFPSPLLNE
jgi:hypothetical protein